MDPATALLLGTGANFIGGLAQGDPPVPDPTYTAPLIPEQGALVQQMLRQMMAGGGGDMGFAQGAQQASGQLESLMRDRGFGGTLGAGGAGTSLLQQAMSDVASNAAMTRFQRAMALAQARPAMFNYQHLGSSPYGPKRTLPTNAGGAYNWSGGSNANTGWNTDQLG